MKRIKSIPINYKSFKKFFSILTPLIIILSVVTGVVHYTVNFVETKILKDTLAIIEPIFLFLNLSLIVIFFVLNFNDIKKLFKNIKTSTWIFLIIIFLLSFVLRMYVTPHTHRVYFDEDIYLDIGKEILLRGKGSLCNYGDSRGCYEYDFMKWPNGYPVTLSIPYTLFGINETAAYNFTAILGSLSVVLVFFVSYLLFKNEKIGLYAALLFALIPVHIMWSGTTAAEPILIFFTLLAVFCLLLSFEFDSLKMTALALFSLAYAIQIKAEGIFLLPIFVLMMLFLDKGLMKKLKNHKIIFLFILFFMFITPYLIHIEYADKTDTWGADGKKFGFEYAQKNIPENFWFWVHGYPTIEHPILFTIFALIGAVFCLKKELKKFVVLSSWFLIFFLIYGFFYAGSVRYGVDVRYALNGYPSFILFAGYGIYALSKFFIKKRVNVHIFDIILVAVILSSFIYFYLPSVSTPADKIQDAYGARHYHEFALENAKKLDENCYILSHVPSMYLLIDKASLQTWNGQNEQRMKELFNKTDCVIFDDGYWCTIPPYQESVCKQMFDKYTLKIIDQFNDNVEQKIYTFYRVVESKEW